MRNMESGENMDIPYEIAIEGKSAVESYVENRVKEDRLRQKQRGWENESYEVLKRIRESTKKYPFTDVAMDDSNTKFNLFCRPEEIWRIVQMIKNDLAILEQLTVDMIDNRNKFDS
ncbi:hypothetical protein ACW2QC_09200 [Virgibacillus sp. FSP13]